MASHQVSLSDPAYAALRQAKADAESFSDVVLRLARHGGAQPDPWEFVRAKRRKTLSAAKRLAEVEAWRDADRVGRKE